MAKSEKQGDGALRRVWDPFSGLLSSERAGTALARQQFAMAFWQVWEYERNVFAHT
jgi:hypothetical protein